MNNTPHILVVGSANVDFIMTVPTLPARGETVTDGKFIQTFGGKGANQATAVARAGAQTTFVCCVGSDAFGQQMIENFREDGMNVSGIKQSKSEASGAALVMIEQGGMNYLTVAPGANHDLFSADLAHLSKALSGVDMLILQMEIPVETNLHAAELARAAGVPVMLNFAPASTPAPELIARTDFLIVNENECEQLTGIYPGDESAIESALARLLTMGPTCAIITLGGEGCAARKEGQTYRLLGFPVDVVDTTAAGDTFCGALAVVLAEGKELSVALTFACAAAALSVTKSGAQPSIPKRSEIETFLTHANG
jgi:ribokinase